MASFVGTTGRLPGPGKRCRAASARRGLPAARSRPLLRRRGACGARRGRPSRKYCWTLRQWTRSKASDRREQIAPTVDRPRPWSGAREREFHSVFRPAPVRRRRRKTRPRRPAGHASTRLGLPGAVGFLAPRSADEPLLVRRPPSATNLVQRGLGSLILHPFPQLGAGAISPLHQLSDLLRVGRASARV